MDNVIELKILPEYFKAQISGDKNFEIRKNDRYFDVGQHLKLREWNEIDGYTGNYIVVKITYITDYAQKKGYVVLGTTRTFVILTSGDSDD